MVILDSLFLIKFKLETSVSQEYNKSVISNFYNALGCMYSLVKNFRAYPYWKNFLFMIENPFSCRLITSEEVDVEKWKMKKWKHLVNTQFGHGPISHVARNMAYLFEDSSRIILLPQLLPYTEAGFSFLSPSKTQTHQTSLNQRDLVFQFTLALLLSKSNHHWHFPSSPKFASATSH